MLASWDIRRPRRRFSILLPRKALSFPLLSLPARQPTTLLPAFTPPDYPLAFGRDVLGIAPDEPTIASALKLRLDIRPQPSAQRIHTFPRASDMTSDSICFVIFWRRSHNHLHRTAILDGGWVSKVNRNIQKVSTALGPLRGAYDELYFQYCQREDSCSTVSRRLTPLPICRRCGRARSRVARKCWIVSLLSLVPFDGSALPVLSEAESA